MFQVKIGRRHMIMPGARKSRMVTTRFTAVAMVAALVSDSPTIHRSTPTLGVARSSDSGAYPVQPMFAAPPLVTKPTKITSPPPRNSQ